MNGNTGPLSANTTTTRGYDNQPVPRTVADVLAADEAKQIDVGVYDDEDDDGILDDDAAAREEGDELEDDEAVDRNARLNERRLGE